nr:molybdenum cofactor biosynthesis protein MoaE [Methanobrevibacter arboriphilus]
MKKIAESVKIKYGVYGVAIVHFIGEFYTGDPLFLTAVLGPHRNETLDALKEVIERTKFDVDFKKKKRYPVLELRLLWLEDNKN